MPKVSVVIPSLNRQSFVHQCLDSILGQTFRDFEVLVQDGGSADGTIEQLDAYRDARVKLAIDKEDGPIVLINNAIRRSLGEYIAILGPEDYFLPRKLERQVEHLDANPQIQAVFTSQTFIDEQGEPLAQPPMRIPHVETAPISRLDWLKRFFLSGNFVCHSTVLLRRSCFDAGLYDVRMGNLADLDMWIRLCLTSDVDLLTGRMVAVRLPNWIQAFATRPTDLVQSAWAMRHILTRYVDLDEETFVRIFGECDAAMDSSLSVKERLCQIALLGESTAHHAFALDTLYNDLKSCTDPRKYKRLIALSGDIDYFNIAAVDRLERGLTLLNHELQTLQPTSAHLTE